MSDRLLSSERHTHITVFLSVLKLRSELSSVSVSLGKRIEITKMSLLYRGQAFQGKEPFFLCVNKFLKVAVLLQKLFHFIKIVLYKTKNIKKKDLPLFESNNNSIYNKSTTNQTNVNMIKVTMYAFKS